ncbi:unnamed protein product [Clonostachys rosea f. rosea IK726]|uniref:Uncharacterized protein n=2 Tax=Bionectria ochroleuca TaxID=29856 RepID=A0A0B7JKH6_BIOOC|nr:unnamed protein product [Clonostachys rosea f. rosea IK726]
MSDKQSYFSPTPTSTPSSSSSPPSTPDLEEVKINTDDLKKDPNQHLPALMRDFPKPEGDLDIGEALGRQPGRWTISGQMEANRARSQQQRARQISLNLANTAKQDLDAIKAKLLASHQKMQSR